MADTPLGITIVRLLKHARLRHRFQPV